MRLLIFGGRNYLNWERAIDELRKFQTHRGRISLVIHGDASGADTMGRVLACCMLGCPHLAFPADWANIDSPHALVKRGKHGPYNALAGFQRNEQMIIEGRPNWGMGFPGGSGTADMAKRLELAGIPIWNAGYKP